MLGNLEVMEALINRMTNRGYIHFKKKEELSEAKIEACFEETILKSSLLRETILEESEFSEKLIDDPYIFSRFVLEELVETRKRERELLWKIIRVEEETEEVLNIERVREREEKITRLQAEIVDLKKKLAEARGLSEADLNRLHGYLNRPIAELELTVRAANCLEEANIVTVRDLVTKTESEMLKTRNFGRRSLNELKDILAEMGLKFGMDTAEVEE